MFHLGSSQFASFANQHAFQRNSQLAGLLASRFANQLPAGKPSKLPAGQVIFRQQPACLQHAFHRTGQLAGLLASQFDKQLPGELFAGQVGVRQQSVCQQLSQFARQLVSQFFSELLAGVLANPHPVCPEPTVAESKPVSSRFASTFLVHHRLASRFVAQPVCQAVVSRVVRWPGSSQVVVSLPATQSACQPASQFFSGLLAGVLANLLQICKRAMRFARQPGNLRASQPVCQAACQPAGPLANRFASRQTQYSNYTLLRLVFYYYSIINLAHLGQKYRNIQQTELWNHIQQTELQNYKISKPNFRIIKYSHLLSKRNFRIIKYSHIFSKLNFRIIKLAN